MDLHVMSRVKFFSSYYSRYMIQFDVPYDAGDAAVILHFLSRPDHQ